MKIAGREIDVAAHHEPTIKQVMVEPFFFCALVFLECYEIWHKRRFGLYAKLRFRFVPKKIMKKDELM
jgi:hypothetical protein